MRTTEIPATVGEEIPVPTLAELIAAGVVLFERVGFETRIRRAAVAARELIAVACHEYRAQYGHIRRVADAYGIIQTALATHSPEDIVRAEANLRGCLPRESNPDPDVWLDRAITDLMQARYQCRCGCPECFAAQDPPYVRYLAQMREESHTADGSDIIWFLRAADDLELWWQLTMPHLFRQGTTASEIVDLVRAD